MPSDPQRGNSLRLETLEGRLMLAGDLLSDYWVPTETPDPNAGSGGVVPASEALILSSDSAAEGEDTPAVDLVAFAKALAATDGVKLFGAAWCPACTEQKELFEDGGQFLPFIEVTNPDRTRNATGIAENITSYPTWEFPDGSREVGLLPLETIASRSGVAIPTSADPFVAPIEDTIVLDGSPLHVGLDGYDPNGGPLTFTVTSSDPSVVQPTVLSGNRSAAIRFAGWGEMVLQLFEQRAAGATGRFIELAEAGFYDTGNNDPDVTAHRVKDDFMLQFGDPTGTGAGGSDLGNFDDDFDPDLQHNTAGIFSWAKSNDDTNDSQVFVIDVPTRYLDFNHSVFGMLTEGDKVRDEMTKTATDENWRPLVPMNIDSVSIFDDTENGVVMLKAVEGATGTSTITVTVTDEDGNSSVETFEVTVEADTFNGGPYLDDIDPVSTTVGNAAVFQLSAIDVEGDAVLYGGAKSGTVDYTLSVDAQSGVVTVLPPAGYIGAMEVLVYTRPATTSDTSDVFDTQLVAITVAPNAPQGVDLLAASDSGASDTDNVTNITDLEFQIDGVTDGALVRLHHGDTVLGQATASGTSVTISTSALSGMGDGTFGVFATQVLDGIESPVSATLDVTLDTTAPPAFTSTPPTVAQVDQLLSYNVENTEEGTAGTVYALSGAPTGVTIGTADGELSWTPGINDVGTHQFVVALTDLAGNTRSQDLDIEVGSSALVGFRVEITDRSGTPVSSVLVGDEFDVRVYVADIAAVPHGVFAAFIDLLYDQQLAALDGVIAYGDQYPNNRVSDLSTPGIVDETGAVSGTVELGGGEFLLLNIPMQAIHAGNVVFQSDPADIVPAHELLRYGGDFDVLEEEVIYGSATLTIDPAFGANDDIFNVDEDGSATALDVLANDEAFEGSTGEFTITEVSATDRGGTITIATDGKTIEYVPAVDFFGEEMFTYTVSDGTGTDTASVTVQVMPTNDDPTANDDTIVVMEDAVDFVIDVLDNDSIAPDEGETLTITSFAALSSGGSLTITPEGDRLLYSPAANFFGTETFTYTADDGNGGTDSATVTVTVAEQNDPPEATNDLFNVDEDSTDNTLDVLANDSTAGDPDETLTITEVSAPEHGGTAVIAADQLSLIYTPAADFFGTERFTYKITDGNGGIAEASITVVVAGTNDPPTANDDSFTIVKGTSDNLLAVIDNDSSDPDDPEVLKVISVAAVTTGGTATVAADGAGILYTPDADFTSEQTLIYTIEDPDGATSEATVTVSVLEYIPSKLSGKVYMDVDNDGVFGADETPVGGVMITLRGTDMFDAAVEQQQTTDALGSYQFLDLAPGSYEIVEAQPTFLIDGIDRAGSQFFAAGTDTLSIDLEQDSDITDFDFGERGRTANRITLVDFFASRVHDSVLLAVTPDGEEQWYAVERGWTQAQTLSFDVQDNMATANLDVTTIDSQQYSTTIDLTDPDQVQQLGSLGTDYLMRVVATPASLFPDADCACAPDGGEAEGEAASLVVAVGDAEGEAFLTAATTQLDARLIAEPITLPAIVTPPSAAAALPLNTLPLNTLPLNTLLPNLLPNSVPTFEAGEGEEGDAVTPRPATPADSYLAADLLLAEPAELDNSNQVAEQLFASVTQDNDDYVAAVDDLMAETQLGQA